MEDHSQKAQAMHCYIEQHDETNQNSTTDGNNRPIVQWVSGGKRNSRKSSDNKTASLTMAADVEEQVSIQLEMGRSCKPEPTGSFTSSRLREWVSCCASYHQLSDTKCQTQEIGENVSITVYEDTEDEVILEFHIPKHEVSIRGLGTQRWCYKDFPQILEFVTETAPFDHLKKDEDAKQLSTQISSNQEPVVADLPRRKKRARSGVSADNILPDGPGSKRTPKPKIDSENYIMPTRKRARKSKSSDISNTMEPSKNQEDSCANGTSKDLLNQSADHDVEHESTTNEENQPSLFPNIIVSENDKSLSQHSKPSTRTQNTPKSTPKNTPQSRQRNAEGAKSSSPRKRSKLSLKGTKGSIQQKLTFEKKPQGIEAPPRKVPCVASIRNLGNTCFMSSVVQVLRYSPGFVPTINDLAKAVKITQMEAIRDRIEDETLQESEQQQGEEALLKEKKTWHLVLALEETFEKMVDCEMRYRMGGDKEFIATRPYALLNAFEQMDVMYEAGEQQDCHELYLSLLAHLSDCTRDINAIRMRNLHQTRIAKRFIGDCTVDKVAELNHSFSCDNIQDVVATKSNVDTIVSGAGHGEFRNDMVSVEPVGKALPCVDMDDVRVAKQSNEEPIKETIESKEKKELENGELKDHNISDIPLATQLDGTNDEVLKTRNENNVAEDKRRFRHKRSASEDNSITKALKVTKSPRLHRNKSGSVGNFKTFIDSLRDKENVDENVQLTTRKRTSSKKYADSKKSKSNDSVMIHMTSQEKLVCKNRSCDVTVKNTEVSNFNVKETTKDEHKEGREETIIELANSATAAPVLSCQSVSDTKDLESNQKEADDLSEVTEPLDKEVRNVSSNMETNIQHELNKSQDTEIDQTGTNDSPSNDSLKEELETEPKQIAERNENYIGASKFEEDKLEDPHGIKLQNCASLERQINGDGSIDIEMDVGTVLASEHGETISNSSDLTVCPAVTSVGTNADVGEKKSEGSFIGTSENDETDTIFKEKVPDIVTSTSTIKDRPQLKRSLSDNRVSAPHQLPDDTSVSVLEQKMPDNHVDESEETGSINILESENCKNENDNKDLSSADPCPPKASNDEKLNESLSVPPILSPSSADPCPPIASNDEKLNESLSVPPIRSPGSADPCPPIASNDEKPNESLSVPPIRSPGSADPCPPIASNDEKLNESLSVSPIRSPSSIDLCAPIASNDENPKESLSATNARKETDKTKQVFSASNLVSNLDEFELREPKLKLKPLNEIQVKFLRKHGRVRTYPDKRAKRIIRFCIKQTPTLLRDLPDYHKVQMTSPTRDVSIKLSNLSPDLMSSLRRTGKITLPPKFENVSDIHSFSSLTTVSGSNEMHCDPTQSLFPDENNKETLNCSSQSATESSGHNKEGSTENQTTTAPATSTTLEKSELPTVPSSRSDIPKYRSGHLTPFLARSQKNSSDSSLSDYPGSTNNDTLVWHESSAEARDVSFENEIVFKHEVEQLVLNDNREIHCELECDTVPNKNLNGEDVTDALEMKCNDPKIECSNFETSGNVMEVDTTNCEGSKENQDNKSALSNGIESTKEEIVPSSEEKEVPSSDQLKSFHQVEAIEPEQLKTRHQGVSVVKKMPSNCETQCNDTIKINSEAASQSLKPIATVTMFTGQDKSTKKQTARKSFPKLPFDVPGGTLDKKDEGSSLQSEMQNNQPKVRLHRRPVHEYLEHLAGADLSVGSCDPVEDVVARSFTGQQVSQLRCLECDREGSDARETPYHHISVDVTSQRDQMTHAEAMELSDTGSDSDAPHEWVMSEIEQVEKLSGNNKYSCANCDMKCEAEIRTRITSAPQMLVLQLKLFRYSPVTMNFTKLKEHRPIPLTLPCIEDVCRKTPGKCSHRYELYAVITHTGFSLSQGHYVAFIKVTELPPVLGNQIIEDTKTPGFIPESNSKESSQEIQSKFLNKNVVVEEAEKDKLFDDQNSGDSEISGTDAPCQRSDVLNQSAPELRPVDDEDMADPNNNADTNNNLDNSENNPTENNENNPAAVENSMEISKSTAWIECDDERISELSQHDFERTISPGSAMTPYMLFYKRV